MKCPNTPNVEFPFTFDVVPLPCTVAPIILLFDDDPAGEMERLVVTPARTEVPVAVIPKLESCVI